MLLLATDLRLLNEAADEVAVLIEVLAEHLDRGVATRVGSRPFRTEPMPPRAISPSMRQRS